MKFTKASARLALFIAIGTLAHTGYAQAVPAGKQQLQLSAFVAGTGTYTDLEGGKNLGITAGVDLTFLALPPVRPSFEARGTYPIDEGHISSQKNFLLGPKVEYPIGTLPPLRRLPHRPRRNRLSRARLSSSATSSTSAPTPSSTPPASVSTTTSPIISPSKPTRSFSTGTPPQPASGTLNPTALTFGARL